MEVMSHSSAYLLPHGNPSSLTYALIILNQRLPRFTPLLWKHAHVHICADGGANRLYDDMPLFFPEEDGRSVRLRYKPDAIKGDLDSIRADVQEFYSNLGTKIEDASRDQDTTDLHKCVDYILNMPNLEQSNLRILAVGALGGRFDHEMGNINVICRFSDVQLILLSDHCLIQLLPHDYVHRIQIQSSVEGPDCGLIPIAGPSRRITTTGLKWNLTDAEMSFGKLVSTSNSVQGDVVTVTSDSDLLWTITIKRPQEKCS
ncbi:kinase [Lithospermum erythrorhizon]|uniref:Thiamine pyrophosphokinase n=1 Tax=Lithospermum erythrorhizon TaxID=34254 RepID=A0AAV3QAW2_LITER